ncbi:MAG: EAL domain-containing protein [Sphingomonadales bacterium]|nr:EAL domain-containing protein [Sphingomonadales bacterium]
MQAGATKDLDVAGIDKPRPDRTARALAGKVRGRHGERDLLLLGVTAAATILFVGNGGTVLGGIVASAAGLGMGPDRLLTNALLLNIALLILGWRRHEQLSREVREHRLAEEQARLLAETDALTGCLNRRSIGPLTDRLIAEAQARGEVTTFIMIDLDNFKQINDFNGHAVGDQLLVECARRIGEVLPAGSLLARLGGDEFACVVSIDPHRPEIVDGLAERIIRAVSAPVRVGEFRGQVTVSLGLTRSDCRNQLNHGPIDAATLLHMADIAMYQAKKNGRNRHLWFEGTMESEIRYRSELESALRRGITQGEFVPYYEQQIDLRTGELTGFEMLARWNSPQLGLVGPEVFIPIAEEIGLIGELSEQVIAQALRDAREWAPQLTLSVNISPIQLRDPWFAQKLLKLLVEANFPPSRLDIEITETCLHQNISGVHTLITSLKNQGIGISLDDFGTGYSSLSQLKSLPFDRIKIDRSFITTMANDAESETIVHTIKSLGEGFGLPITAEGIESREVLEKLQKIGNFKGQGYLYGRPVPADMVNAMLAQRDLMAAPAAPAPPPSPDGETRGENRGENRDRGDATAAA